MTIKYTVERGSDFWAVCEDGRVIVSCTTYQEADEVVRELGADNWLSLGRPYAYERYSVAMEHNLTGRLPNGYFSVFDRQTREVVNGRGNFLGESDARDWIIRHDRFVRGRGLRRS